MLSFGVNGRAFNLTGCAVAFQSIAFAHSFASLCNSSNKFRKCATATQDKIAAAAVN
jgi:hypothetical protein